MTDPVHLGPFELGDRIGRGGMGVVHRARHFQTGQPVAVKVLLAEPAREPDKQQAFRREVQALAKLHHPAVATVLDYGAVDDETAARGPDAFAAGVPWFAMEYVDGRPMSTMRASRRWERLRSTLTAVLDGLAHAHARSIVHRDLKPGNVLMEVSAEGGEPQPRLVDFGIARIFDSSSGAAEESSKPIRGTPNYMAPEQIRGAWRDQGPWTDLYALGCLVWRLVCGTAVFDRGTKKDVLRAHLEEEPAAFEPEIPVPEGLERWLRGLLRKEIDRRTGRAADAAWQLLQLGEPRSSAGERPRRESEDAVRETTDVQSPLQTTIATLPKTIATEQRVAEGEEEDTADFDGATTTVPTGDAASERPPVPPDWRRGGAERRGAVLPMAGLELFALREVPTVDRVPERDRIWELLRRVGVDGSPRLVTLEAGAGAGKSQLARWLCRRALETGAAELLRVSHGRSDAPDAGLRRMVQARLRTRGLARGDVHERLLQRLPPREGEVEQRLVDARALTELLRPTDDDAESVDGPQYRFSDPNQKYALIRRVFERFSRERPLVVWFDDLQWGRESIGVLDHLYAIPEETPSMLAVATVRSDLVAEEPKRRERLEALYSQADAVRIEVSPLDPADHRTLIDRLLHLDGELADAIAERTEGNPLFAVQLLRELVEGNRLEASSEGYALSPGESLELPEDVHDLWLRRLGRLVDELSGDDTAVWRALECAAALGREVDRGEWRALCEELGMEDPGLLQDALVGRGLAERTDEGWAFAHGLLVDSLERRARGRGRRRDHHRRCATLLETLYPAVPGRTAARRADHWVEADEAELALEPLLQADRRLNDLGDVQGGREKLERRGELLDELGMSSDDPRYIEQRIELARKHVATDGPSDEVMERLEWARSRAESIGDDRLVARAASVMVNMHRALGNLSTACETAREAAERAEHSGDAKVLLGALRRWGSVAHASGSLEAAEERFSECRRRASEQNDRHERLFARRGLALVWMARGRDARAAECLEETLEEARKTGYRSIQGLCHNGLGEIARFGGAVEEARRHYRRFARIFRELGAPRDVAYSHLNLAQVELMDGRFEAARTEFEEGERRLEELSETNARRHLLHLIELTLAVGTEAWSSFDDEYARYEDGWPEDGRLTKDYPWLLELAGDYAAEAGASDRADRAWRLSRKLWRRLDNGEAYERLDRKVDGSG